MEKPKFTRTATMQTRDYLLESTRDAKLAGDVIDSIIKELKYGQRVDPMVDIESHGKANVAKKLRKQGILDGETEEKIHMSVKEIKKAIPGKKEFEKLRILFVNATEFGGGVAEMRPNNARFMEEFGVDGDWAVIDGCEDFYKATVHIHEGIQNPLYSPFEDEEYEVLSIITVNNFARFENLQIFQKYDVIWIDDPQPLAMIPMIKALHPTKPVIWRCHVHADPEPSIRAYITSILEGRFDYEKHRIVWRYMLDQHNIDLRKLTPQQLRVDGAVFHLQEFADGLQLPKDFPVIIMGPAIDPLSYKNMPLTQEFIIATLAHYGIIDAKKHDEAFQLRSERYKSTVLQRALSLSGDSKRKFLTATEQNLWSESSCGESEESSSSEVDKWTHCVPPYILEVSRYDPYKGPFEVVVAFIEAMRKLDDSDEAERLMRENCRFIFAASTPGDNPTGAQILRNLRLFVRNCPALKDGPLKKLSKRIFLLSLKDQRRTEILRKTIFDKIWEKKERKFEAMVNDILLHNNVAPLGEIVQKLLAGPNYFIDEETAKILEGTGSRLNEKGECAYFTLEQTIEAAESMRELPFIEATTWTKVKNNYLSGKEINHLEVNALQTGALVRCQFSSKEGFGLVVSEAMVKAEQCSPPVNGVMVATTVGGVKSQVHDVVGLPVQYPPEEVAESLRMYREMAEVDVKDTQGAGALYESIAERRSVQAFSDAIVRAIRMKGPERELKSRSARNFILNNFSIHSNVRNILDAVEQTVKRFDWDANVLN